MTFRKFVLSVNGETFSNRIVSKFLINEALDYIVTRTNQGFDEFIILSNNESRSFIQCFTVRNKFVVQVSVRIDNQKVKLVEKKGFSRKKVERLFIDFMLENKIDVDGYSDVQILHGKNEFEI